MDRLSELESAHGFRMSPLLYKYGEPKAQRIKLPWLMLRISHSSPVGLQAAHPYVDC